MAKISDHIIHEPIFPKVCGIYELEFDHEESQVIDKWKTIEHQVETSLITTGREKIYEAKPYETIEQRKQWPVWDENFLILHLQKNILKNCPELRSIGQSILHIANHYVRYAYGINLPQHSYLDFSDSWMIKLQGRDDGGDFRKHNHAFSWLTGVCYLDDSDCGFALHNGETIGSSFDNDNYPFIFPPEITEPTLFNQNTKTYEVKKGRVLIFNSRMHHSLFDHSSPEDVRYSFAFNIWPYGSVNDVGGAILEYQAPLPRDDL